MMSKFLCVKCPLIGQGSTQIKEKVPHFLREKKIICRSEKVGIFLEHPIERNQNNKFPAIYRTETHQRIHK